ncbi:NAD(P)/FAD-dependent oxidoreductase [Ruicaihuangia caeni]|uniref:FAD-dependent oxidoreductase n=1 Tax=Ruicaihuangia caeni TaxID=3042517 RepID=A0AAW6T4M1_9MICO|nr:FAD-dependent oxidoreductase [Klugiella sp. YN-L-19]MDI2098765.1 FAD-dependent oxidoreductase [Klugiella sp. YN-L-19]
MGTDRFVIVGGGLAAVNAAETLRDEGFDGDIVIIGAEKHLPYERPPLSKGYLLGQEPREKAFPHSAAWYAEHDVDVVSEARAVRLDVGANRLTLADDEKVSYDRLLIATGADPRRIGIPGVHARGVHYLRSIDDSEHLRDALKSGDHRVVLIGSGWIGLELAAAARTYGNEVTVVGRDKVPLDGPLGTDLGTMFLRLHQEHGVVFELESEPQEFAEADGQVTGVVVDGRTIPADVVIVGVGVVPNVELAEHGGIEVKNGIVVDEHMRTSDPDVFAAGDVASAYHPVIGQHMRNEHWANAIDTGKTAAKSMLGIRASHDGIPYFFTDQYDLGMEYSGYPPLTKDAEVIVRGDREKREFVAFWLADDRVVAGMNVNVWDVNEQVQELIRSARAVDRTRLQDPSVALADV